MKQTLTRYCRGVDNLYDLYTKKYTHGVMPFSKLLDHGLFPNYVIAPLSNTINNAKGDGTTWDSFSHMNKKYNRDVLMYIIKSLRRFIDGDIQ